MQDSQRRRNIDSTTMTKLNFVILCGVLVSSDCYSHSHINDVQCTPYKRYVHRLVVGVCVQDRSRVAVETIHVTIMPQLVAISIRIGDASERKRGDCENSFDGEHDEDDLENRPSPSFHGESELRTIHGVGAVDVISALVKLTDCGGLSIYVCIEEGPAMRVNASISEREARRNRRLRSSRRGFGGVWRRASGSQREVHVR